MFASLANMKMCPVQDFCTLYPSFNRHGHTSPWTSLNNFPYHKKKVTIWVVVNRLTKYGHFIALTHPYSAFSLAVLFVDSIYKLHGLPQSMMTDRDRVFTSHFWKQLFQLWGLNNTSVQPTIPKQMDRLRGSINASKLT